MEGDLIERREYIGSGKARDTSAVANPQAGETSELLIDRLTGPFPLRH